MEDDSYSNIDLNLKSTEPKKKAKKRHMLQKPGEVAKPEGKQAKHKKEDDGLSSIQLFKEIPQKIPFMGRPREHTISVALPASLVQNVQSEELRAYVIGNIARTLTIYGINEVVLYNDMGNEGTKWQDHFALNLRYLETPQYLRRYLYPMNYALKYAGLQNPLDAPHHLRSNEWLPYREGVIKLIPKSQCGKHNKFFAECGLFRNVEIKNISALSSIYGVDHVTDDGDEEIYQRVTIRLDGSSLTQCKQYWKNNKLGSTDSGNYSLSGYIVSPEEPLQRAGLYWGYTVREADSFEQVLVECPFNDSGEYDYKIGTSERGELFGPNTKLPKYKNLLVVFGPVNGLEHIMENPSDKFDKYYNFCLHQKSRTIRTEEALSISLAIMNFVSPY
ncbi:hypothetical protein BEWA_030760 [Theileria equi strain WA]|uniref:RNA methyltransferase n=1 Tax=Theileria equi strain WA TaxID=1537102 RepID=L0AY88_THEEQ|nr:hypothetical protein BEWA_030760 [Theileria equi strain WA]AFZ80223.1 hypothetical protein BEWA_030760 [Theileria equi strain WA]|eukprot:XP_004829889.1 hypothetical protein BEWA_030760 [Theileria equi strain WA]